MFTNTNDMKEAFKDADIVYPKSCGQIRLQLWRREQTFMQRAIQRESRFLDSETSAQNAEHKDWACTEEMMKFYKGR